MLRSRCRQSHVPESVDLHTQLESILDCVWRAEKMWRLEDRISMARIEERRARRKVNAWPRRPNQLSSNAAPYRH